MSYVDGFVIPVPAGMKQAYKEMAAKAAPIFMEYGATRLVECWGNDLPRGEATDFYMSVNAEEGENVVFSWIIWPSKAVRDEANKKIMVDPRMKMEPDMPMDPKRLIYGGFEVLLDTAGEL